MIPPLTDRLAIILQGALRNIDGRCAVCAGAVDPFDYYLGDAGAPGESTTVYELVICATCARDLVRWLITDIRREDTP